MNAWFILSGFRQRVIDLADPTTLLCLSEHHFMEGMRVIKELLDCVKIPIIYFPI
jgi:hypothetical protein